MANKEMTRGKGSGGYQFRDVSGIAFGRLTPRWPVDRAGKSGERSLLWLASCECGELLIVKTRDLVSGNTQSCGCLRKQLTAALGKRNLQHGHSRRTARCSPTYWSWRSMLSRCENPTNVGFRNYGGRGIWVCKRWGSFQNFLQDMGERPLGKTLDRINVNGNYELRNCRWATQSEQVANRRKMIPVMTQMTLEIVKSWATL